MIITLPEDELDRIHRVAGQEHRALWASEGWQAIVSCNPSRLMWPSVGYGRSTENQREYLDPAEFPALVDAVDLLLRRKRLGGRIFIRDDTLWYAPKGGKTQLAKFGVVSRRIPVRVRVRR